MTDRLAEALNHIEGGQHDPYEDAKTAREALADFRKWREGR